MKWTIHLSLLLSMDHLNSWLSGLVERKLDGYKIVDNLLSRDSLTRISSGCFSVFFFFCSCTYIGSRFCFFFVFGVCWRGSKAILFVLSMCLCHSRQWLWVCARLRPITIFPFVIRFACLKELGSFRSFRFSSYVFLMQIRNCILWLQRFLLIIWSFFLFYKFLTNKLTKI